METTIYIANKAAAEAFLVAIQNSSQQRVSPEDCQRHYNLRSNHKKGILPITKLCDKCAEKVKAFLPRSVDDEHMI